MGDTPLPDPSPPVEPPKPSRRYHFDPLRDYSSGKIMEHMISSDKIKTLGPYDPDALAQFLGIPDLKDRSNSYLLITQENLLKLMKIIDEITYPPALADEESIVGYFWRTHKYLFLLVAVFILTEFSGD